MDFLLLADLGSAIRGAADTVTSNPLGTVGWTAIAYATLRIIVAQFGDKLPGVIVSLLAKIPGFPPAIVPVVETTLAQILKQLFDHLLKQGVPATEAAAIVQGVAKQSAPAVLAAMQSEFEAEVLAATKGA